MSEINTAQFSAKGLSFRTQENVQIIQVDNDFATAEITPHGGCVLSFIAKSGNLRATNSDSQDLLWVSPSAVYNAEKPVRGGVPICWPWFGAHPTEEGLPAHGFVRNTLWQLEKVNDLASGATEVILSLKSSAQTLKIWPYAFHLELKVTVAEKLSLALTTTNLTEQDMTITEAFHTYFNVADANGLPILGLENATHLDKLTHAKPKLQTDTLILKPPMDSVYLNHTSEAVIDDVGHQRKIKIEKQHSASSVVWNPGSEIVKGFNDIPHDQWPSFVCVESGNIFENAVTIKSGQKHSLCMQLSSVSA